MVTSTSYKTSFESPDFPDFKIFMSFSRFRLFLEEMFPFQRFYLFLTQKVPKVFKNWSNESQSLHRQRHHRQMTSPTDDFTDRWLHRQMTSPTDDFTDRWLHRQMTSPTDDFTDKLKRSKNWSIIYSEKIFCRLSLFRRSHWHNLYCFPLSQMD